MLGHLNYQVAPLTANPTAKSNLLRDGLRQWNVLVDRRDFVLAELCGDFAVCSRFKW
jgi:hypothetical protein